MATTKTFLVYQNDKLSYEISKEGYKTSTDEVVISTPKTISKTMVKLYTLTIKQSFGRINSKKLILELQKYVNLDFTHQKSYKYNARYNNGQKMLIVDIKEAINNA